MKILRLILTLTLFVSPFVVGYYAFSQQNNVDTYTKYDEKIYVAIEAEGRVGVYDSATRKLVKSINLSDSQNGEFVKYTAHNVQVSPNGEFVLVTGNVNRGDMNDESDEKNNDGLYDKVFIIDPKNDSVVYSIPVERDAHLAHVVVNTTGTQAYVSSQEKSKVYVIDLESNKITRTIDLADGDGPHGMRLSADDSKLYVALIGGKSITEVDLNNFQTKRFSFDGAVIQTAISFDGNYIFGSVYDTKKVAWIDTNTSEQGYIELPSDAKGSVQLYATPDSKYLYVVNQGYYFDQPKGNNIYRINIAEKQVDQNIPTGDAPHGVVVDGMGKFAYVTNLISDDMSIVDTYTGKEVARIRVGNMPNGISIWNKKLGGTR